MVMMMKSKIDCGLHGPHIGGFSSYILTWQNFMIKLIKELVSPDSFVFKSGHNCQKIESFKPDKCTLYF